jgi:hypothetical protein
MISGAPRPRRRRAALAPGLIAILLAALATPVDAQRGEGGGRYAEPGDNPAYDGRFTFARLRYEMDGWFGGGGRGRGGGQPPWAHDYPDGERNFTSILAELSTVRTRTMESVVLSISDPELGKYPVSYMSEPGFWRITEGDAVALRKYLLKGGFIIFDDFREDDWFNLVEQMRRALPDHRWQPIDGTHPIFDSFYRIPTPETLGSYGRYQPTFWVLFEDNDPKKRIIALANRDNDLSEYWEYSATGMYPVDLTNEAYKIGINYIIYALSR